MDGFGVSGNSYRKCVLVWGNVISLLDKIIEAAQKLGSLTPAAIFALGDIFFGFYFWKQLQKSEDWRQTREKQIAADVAHVEAMNRVAEKLSELEMALIKFVIKRGD